MEAKIDSCFSCKTEFHYPKSIEKFDDLLEIFKAPSKAAKRKDDYSSSDDDGNTSSSDPDEYESDGFREKAASNWLIVMDDILGFS